jgi:hypothetical protein
MSAENQRFSFIKQFIGIDRKKKIISRWPCPTSFTKTLVKEKREAAYLNVQS